LRRSGRSRQAARVEANSVSPPLELSTRAARILASAGTDRKVLSVCQSWFAMRFSVWASSAGAIVASARRLVTLSRRGCGPFMPCEAVLDRPEQRGEGEMRRIVEALVAEQQQRMPLEGGADIGIALAPRLTRRKSTPWTSTPKLGCQWCHAHRRLPAMAATIAGSTRKDNTPNRSAPRPLFDRPGPQPLRVGR